MENKGRGISNMDKVVWNDRLNIGVEVVDKAHAKLFQVVGNLIELVENEANYQGACKKGLAYLEDYTMKHFSEEEAYMRSIHYRGYAKHKEIHDTFRDQTLVSLKKTLELADYSRIATERFLGILLGWLTGHIMMEDQEITAQNPAAPSYQIASQTEISAAVQAVSQAMKNVFGLEAKLIDDHYDGRNMGMAHYCRLNYDAEDGGKVQLLLAGEKRLIRRGVGMLFGVAAMQNTAMLEEASLQILKQFLHYMNKTSDSEKNFQLCKEELLSINEFRSDFMTRYPCCLLFETRLGYFVFCSRKWKVKKKKDK